jgi:dihydrodipicolinate reductase
LIAARVRGSLTNQRSQNEDIAMYYKQSEIKDHLTDYVAENYFTNLSEIDPVDLHHEAFNQDYYIIGTYKAAQWLGDHVFECINIIKEYEQDHFGEVFTDFSNPEAVVNMYTYIIGEKVVHEWLESLESAA